MAQKKDSRQFPRASIIVSVLILLSFLPFEQSFADSHALNEVDESSRQQSRNLNFYRLILSPTAHPLPRNSGYFTDTWVIWPALTFAPLDNLSLTGGAILMPYQETRPGGCGDCYGSFGATLARYIAPKLAFDLSHKWAVALTGVYVSAGDDDRAWATYGLASYGSPRANITAGLGYGRDLEKYHSPYEDYDAGLVMLGGFWQYEKSAALVFESHLPLTRDKEQLDNTLILVAARFFGRHISFDITLATTPEALFESGLLPLLTFGYAFGG